MCEKDSKTRKWSAYAWLALARWTRWVYMSKRVHDRRSDSVEIVHLLPATPGITTLMNEKNLVSCSTVRFFFETCIYMQS